MAETSLLDTRFYIDSQAYEKSFTKSHRFY